jgi:hypothetical protein
MKKKLIEESDYTFNATEGTITFSNEIEQVSLHNLLLITNVTDNKVLYNFGCVNYGGTITGLVLNLEQDTSNMSNDDILQIVVYTTESDMDKLVKSYLLSLNEQLGCLQTLIDEQKLTNIWLKEILR